MSRYTSPAESLRQFPTLANIGPGGKKLLGTVPPSSVHPQPRATFDSFHAAIIFFCDDRAYVDFILKQ
jgi:hypothetical protein